MSLPSYTAVYDPNSSIEYRIIFSYEDLHTHPTIDAAYQNAMDTFKQVIGIGTPRLDEVKRELRVVELEIMSELLKLAREDDVFSKWTRFRGQRLTEYSSVDSRLSFGGGLGRAGWTEGRRVGDHRGIAAA